MKICIGLIIICLLYWQNTFAQKIAYGSEKGIFLINPIPGASKAKPYKGGTGYIVERTKTGTSAFTRIFSYETPSDFKTFMARQKEYELHQPYTLKIDPINYAEEWKAFQTTNHWDSIKNKISEQPILAAFGILVLDEKAEKNVSYTYRISLVDEKGSIIESLTSNPVKFPEKMTYTKPRYFNQTTDGESLTMFWKAASARKPHHFKVYRSEGERGVYKELNIYANISIVKDSIVYGFTDNNVSKNIMYHYYISPSNNYGNYNLFSDTAIATPYRVRDLDLPIKFTAMGNDSINGIPLSWKMPSPEQIGAIQIFRSTDYENDYSEIISVSGDSTYYLDKGAMPGQKYYYYLKIIDKLGNKSINSSRVFGVYSGTNPPSPPLKVIAKANPRSVNILWIPNGSNLRGYYVYRSEGTGNEDYKQISDFIPYSRDTLMTWNDTTTALISGITYSYTVKQEDNGHLLSLPAAPATVQPLHVNSAAVRLPLINLSIANSGKGALLTWDLKTNITGLNGIYVYRKTDTEKDFKIINQIPLRSNTTIYEDSTAVAGDNYSYKISFTGLNDKEIGKSSVVVFNNSAVTLAPPYEVRGQVENNQVKLTWEYTENIAEFIVYKRSPGSMPKKIATLKPNQFLFIDKLNTADGVNIYYLTVKDKNGNESNASNEYKISFL